MKKEGDVESCFRTNIHEMNERDVKGGITQNTSVSF